tara:strand:+ start:14127 stop:14546 length:420 start_codon:yes stop_codon:yes gene_type:complete
MDAMDLIKGWWPVFAGTVSFIGLFLIYMMRDKFVAKKSYDEAVKQQKEDFDEYQKDVKHDFEMSNKELDNLKQRLTKAEADIKTKPNDRAIHELMLSVSEMNGSVKELTAKHEGTEKIMGMINKKLGVIDEHLLNQGGS